jgi:hypothetical protein
MLVWPFILLTIGLTAVIGYAITQIEKDKVMANWSNRRCDIPIMTMARYFKPPDDPRTATQFAQDNFMFCMNQLAQNATSVAMMPVNKILSAQVSVSAIITTVFNSIRAMLKVIYDAFLSYMEDYLRKYTAVADQIRNITVRLRTAFNRVNTILLSTVFMGLSIIRGIMNSVDFVIKVVMIILGIMIAIIILLFFILFPFMPLIFSVIGAIMAVAIGSVAAEASGFRSGFCFAPSTRICMKNGESTPIRDIHIGDILADGSIVESVFVMSGRGVPLWRIDNIYVSGTHLIQSDINSDSWHPVSQDSRAHRTSYMEGYIYCLNTSSHTIPVETSDGKHINFRDWEELDNSDRRGHFEWNYNVSRELNKSASYEKWGPLGREDIHYPALSSNTQIKTPNGNISISSVHVGDIVYGHDMKPTEVLGVCTVQTYTDSNYDSWATNMIYLDSDNIWKRTAHQSSTCKAIGTHLITERGTFVVTTENCDIIYRDYTEVGYQHIERINKCVESRLRFDNDLQ